MLALDSHLDSVKVELSKQEDFNLIDAFKFFDHKGRGCISTAELLSGLANLSVSATTDDLYNFLKRFDRIEEDRLKYADFCDAFIPHDSYHANRLCKKQPKI
jgi:Ca2+-binding EF-hand superfamily protein